MGFDTLSRGRYSSQADRQASSQIIVESSLSSFLNRLRLNSDENGRLSCARQDSRRKMTWREGIVQNNARYVLFDAQSQGLREAGGFGKMSDHPKRALVDLAGRSERIRTSTSGKTLFFKLVCPCASRLLSRQQQTSRLASQPFDQAFPVRLSHVDHSSQQRHEKWRQSPSRRTARVSDRRHGATRWLNYLSDSRDWLLLHVTQHRCLCMYDSFQPCCIRGEPHA